MIESYFELTGKLIHDYVGSLHERTFKEDVVVQDENLTQYHLYGDEDKQIVVMIVSVTKLQNKLQVINLVGRGTPSTTDTIWMDWDQFEGEQNSLIQFPLDGINLSSDLIQSFNDIASGQLNKNRYEELFKTRIKSPQKGPEDPPAGAATGIPTSNIPRIDPAYSKPDKAIPDKPGFDDEYEIQRGGHGQPPIGPPAGPPGIGDDDLYPGGIRDPSIKSYMDPLRAQEPQGMYPLREHPLFNRDRMMGGPDNSPMGARYDDPLAEGSANMDLIGDGLPGFRRSSGGTGNPGFTGLGGNHHPFGGL